MPSPPRTRTSTELLAGLRDPRDAAAWEQYVERYRPLLVGYGRQAGLSPHDAEDAAQATLLEFSRGMRADLYDRERGRLRSWLHGIAANKVREARRARREVQAPDTAAEEALDPGEPDPNQAAWDAEWHAAIVRQCLSEVSAEVEPGTLRAFELFVREGLPAQAVAEELGMSRDAVYAAKRRVLRRIRELLPLMDEVY